MTEPKHVYTVSDASPDEVREYNGLGADGLGVEGRGYISTVMLYLSPDHAIKDYLMEFDKFLGENPTINIYEVDLYVLDGVWPRVNPYQFNDYRLRWSAEYRGKIPAAAVNCVNSITKEQWLAANRVEPE